MIRSLRLQLYASQGKSCSMSSEMPEQEEETILPAQEYLVILHSYITLVEALLVRKMDGHAIKKNWE